MSENFGMMDKSYFMGKSELISWVNQVLQMNITQIEQCATGAIYCQLLDVIKPGKVKLSKVNWKASLEVDFLANLKILQQGFIDCGIQKHIDIAKLAKAKFQENMELLQWFKGYFKANNIDASGYQGKKRRNYKEVTFGTTSMEPRGHAPNNRMNHLQPAPGKPKAKKDNEGKNLGRDHSADLKGKSHLGIVKKKNQKAQNKKGENRAKSTNVRSNLKPNKPQKKADHINKTAAKLEETPKDQPILNADMNQAQPMPSFPQNPSATDNTMNQNPFTIPKQDNMPLDIQAPMTMNIPGSMGDGSFLQNPLMVNPLQNQPFGGESMMNQQMPFAQDQLNQQGTFPQSGFGDQCQNYEGSVNDAMNTQLNAMGMQGNPQMTDQMNYQTPQEISDQMSSNPLSIQMSNPLPNSMGLEFSNSKPYEMNLPMDNPMLNQMSDQSTNQVPEQMDNQIPNQTNPDMNNQIIPQMNNEIPEEMSSNVPESMNPQLNEQNVPQFPPQMDMQGNDQMDMGDDSEAMRALEEEYFEQEFKLATAEYDEKLNEMRTAYNHALNHEEQSKLAVADNYQEANHYYQHCLGIEYLLSEQFEITGEGMDDLINKILSTEDYIKVIVDGKNEPHIEVTQEEARPFIDFQQ
ncbi:MAG: hypothetical protein MJ252_23610 [archaeon]|nr:hypothetical protein [archaeon]